MPGKIIPGLVEYCDAILEIDPNNVLAHQIRGEYLLRRGHYDAAIASFDMVIRLDLTLVDAHIGKILTLHIQEKYPAALKCCSEALADHPDSAWLHHSKGVNACTVGQAQRSHKEL